MFAKIVVSCVLVSILPCESQRQQFFQVPFDEAPQLTSGAAQPPIGRVHANQPFPTTDQQLLQADFQNQLNHNHRFNINPVASTPRQRFESFATQEDQLGSPPFAGFSDGSGLVVNQPHLQPTRPNQLRTPIRRRRPTTPAPAPSHFQLSDFPAHQQIQSPNFEQQATLHPESFQSRFQNPKFADFMVIMPLASPPPAADIPSAQRLFVPNNDFQQLNSAPQPLQPNEAPRGTHQFFSIEEPVLRPTLARRPAEVPTTASFLNRAQPAIRAPVPPSPRPAIHHHINKPLNPHAGLNSRFVDESDFLINVQPSAKVPEPPLPQSQPQQVRPPSQPQQVRPPSQPQQVRPPPRQFPSLAEDSQREREEKLFRQQAESAQYSFASQIDDTISGNQHQREEVRDGLAVKGMYSYSDGYVKRTVYYEADEKGYRVVKENEEPLGNGPQTDPRGHADVSTFVGGNSVQYSITADDIQDPNANRVSDQRI